jgi:hypothetical protein
MALALAASPVAILISERYLIVSYPAFALLLAAGFTAIWERTGPTGRTVAVVPVLVVTAMALGRYYMDPRFGKAQWRDVANLIHAERRDGDAIVLDSPMNKDVFRYYAGDVPRVSTADEPVTAAVQGSSRVWLIVSHAPDGGARTRATLESTYAVTRDSLFFKEVGIRVLTMDRRP